MKKILITRPLKDALITAKAFKEQAFKPIISPIIQIVEKDFLLPDKLYKYPFIFTSTNALEICAKHLKNKTNQQIFCLSGNMAQNAKSLGFSDVFYPTTNAPSTKELEKFILKKNLKNHKFIYFCATKISSEFKKIVTEKIVVYESIFNENFKFKANDADILIFFSLLSASYFLEYAKANNLIGHIKNLEVYTLSDSIARSFSSIGCNKVYSLETLTGSISMNSLVELIKKNNL
jgi:uroporphyrinogen-III synthase